MADVPVKVYESLLPKCVLFHGDSRMVAEVLGENSVDALVTDPPYELGFMGRSWDQTGIAFNPDFWKRALAVLKPGAHALIFGGSRTYHRIACAVEDAGFEIRDCVMWMYGCLDSESEALTRRGWVRGPDLLPTDEVCQWFEGGTVLDLFTGSGSTGVAALAEGFSFVGFELTAEYLPIIQARLARAASDRVAAMDLDEVLG